MGRVDDWRGGGRFWGVAVGRRLSSVPVPHSEPWLRFQSPLIEPGPSRLWGSGSQSQAGGGIGFGLEQVGPSRDWGSGRHGQAGGGIGFSIKELAESGAELAVDDGAADLEQAIGAAVVVPPRSTAVPSPSAETDPTQRDRHLQTIAERGRMGWQKASGYNQRAKAEMTAP